MFSFQQENPRDSVLSAWTVSSSSSYFLSEKIPKESSYSDEKLYPVRLCLCAGAQSHVDDVTHYLINRLGHSELPDNHAPTTQERLSDYIPEIVNRTTAHLFDVAGVVAAAHILLLRHQDALSRVSKAAAPSSSLGWNGHGLFLSAFIFAAVEQTHNPDVLNNVNFWCSFSGFTAEAVVEMKNQLYAELHGKVWMFAEIMESANKPPTRKMLTVWRKNSEAEEEMSRGRDTLRPSRLKVAHFFSRLFRLRVR
ncbi:hypothetical protein K443DRAFT_683312 [Laccaria amethystina LaAM-08-1]|uniref:Uncharacterized protein n=1 Tax=Laccaria amethystina LaAM-08-1 TaxID=1095629 RepID=A0A0C9XBF5_9AGAR|nr:hypothetical protein K443DRAFT_683312 [Laccaria amethystina LaAM-08-1]